MRAKRRSIDADVENDLRMGNHVVLIGFMGVGKTTVGRVLAELLRRPFIDLDHLIESTTASTIAEIFAREGEAGFRAREAEAVRRAVGGKPAVIAAGGGTVTTRQNVHALRRAGELVWLRAPFAEMIQRATREGGRPLLRAGVDLRALYESRVPTYSLADLIVDVGEGAPEDAAWMIRRRLSPRFVEPDREAEESHGDAGAEAETEIVRVDLNERAYDVHVGAGLLAESGALSSQVGLGEAGLLVTNGRVGELYASRVVRSLSKSGLRVPRVDIPDGEEHKNHDSLSAIYDAALKYRLGRDGVFYALGGGVVGDAAGFAAATYLRGVDFVQIPTTLLAQVDSSVGGKTAVNVPQGKNLIGAFHQPRLVLADVDTLQTLPKREMAAGLAEVIKYAAIRDEPFFDYLNDRRTRLDAKDAAALTKIVARSCENKAAIVKQDERETGGVRELLNFGHTVGHALEAIGEYTRWLHGEAVAIGMVTAALLSRRFGGLSDEDVQRLIDLLRACHLPVAPGPVDLDALLAALRLDKKVRQGRPRFVLLRSLGSAFISDEVTDEWVKEAIREQQTL